MQFFLVLRQSQILKLCAFFSKEKLQIEHHVDA